MDMGSFRSPALGPRFLGLSHCGGGNAADNVRGLVASVCGVCIGVHEDASVKATLGKLKPE
jgi:coenzyme F420-reducing hydrogenase alpha subunit